MFYGTKGSLAISRSGFTITPDKVIRPENAVPQFTDSQPVGGVARVRDPAEAKLWTTAREDTSGNSLDQFRRHVRNLLDCVKSRETPISDLASAHRVSTACHLANLSLRLGRSFKWDAEHETILNDAEAAAQFVRAYRAPWDRELKALVG